MKFYSHTYGGTAWDIEVKRERFATLFGIHNPELEIDKGKVGNIVHRGNDGRLLEVLGYVRRGPRGGIKYVTTYVQH